MFTPYSSAIGWKSALPKKMPIEPVIVLGSA